MPARLDLHWTRTALLAGALVVIVSTLLPWLVGVPPKLLEIGSGTIRGITTVHGIIVCLAMAGVVAIALRQPRGVRPTRAALGGVLAIAVVTMGVASLVLGTSETEMYEELDRIAPSREVADRAVVALAEQLRGFDMGGGGYVLALGCTVLAVTAIIAMFVKRPAG